MDFQPERGDDFENGVESRGSLTGKGFIETFTGQTGITGNLGYPPRTRYISQGFGNAGGITGCFFHDRFKIGGHFLGGAQVLGNIESTDLCFFHNEFSKLAASWMARLMSLDWARLVPPANRIINSRPLWQKYNLYPGP
jgi:hypothetical protein